MRPDILLSNEVIETSRLSKFDLDWLRNCFRNQGPSVTPDQAEIIAINALGWLAGQEDLFNGFLTASGAAAGDLEARVGDPAFLAAILDFVTSDDRWVRDFCDAFALACDQPLRARYALPGAEQVRWT